ncbi:glycine receptor subunit alpha-2-like isoform X1 [Mercenaria mercenaria]|uniref:glycine receptor subunit alpha-2-like isoform X1 n=1 Tax=Mercenaria mercenaria TaxID=6596 RepID=UPI001E1D5F17|nr:glycine receptor subunit alpha-2-like isoform X1 [Mercenaria mercenaria]
MNILQYKLLVLISLWNFKLTYGQKRQDFIQALLKDYDSRIPPNFEKDYPCEVNVSLYINSIDSIDEQKMDFTLSTFISQEWRDTRLRFRNLIPEEYLELDSRLMGNVWVPDLYFRNEKQAYFHTVTIPNKMLHIFKNGVVKYRSRITLTASCPMKLHKYPMDRQTCSLFIQSFAFSTNRLIFRWRDKDPVRMNPNLELPQFTPYRLETENCTDIGEGNTCLQLNVYLDRNIGFYMIQTYIPSVLIVMLSWLSFWLNVDSVPARISLGILTVLTMTTQRSMSNASLPRVSYVKAIDVWMAVCLCFVFAALLEYACVNVLSRSQLRKKLKKEWREKQNGIQEQKNGLINGLKKKRSRDNAQSVDDVCRVVFPISFLLFCIIYWSCYLTIH